MVDVWLHVVVVDIEQMNLLIKKNPDQNRLIHDD
jgi:hypothetical protein